MNTKVISPSEIIIEGDVKTVSNYQQIKNEITVMLGITGTELTVHMTDSISITSLVIGYFLKLVHQDSINFKLIVYEAKLYALLDELKLIDALNVTMENKIN